jgi:hypothetical protein
MRSYYWEGMRSYYWEGMRSYYWEGMRSYYWEGMRSNYWSNDWEGIASQKYWHGKRGWEKIEHNCFFVPL